MLQISGETPFALPCYKADRGKQAGLCWVHLEVLIQISAV